jgi:hypothetical protein
VLKRLARLFFRRRGRVVLAWIAGIAVIGADMGAAGSGHHSDLTLPYVEGERND